MAINKKEAILDTFDEKHLYRLKSAIELNDATWMVLETDVLLGRVLRENIVAKKVIKQLNKENYKISAKDIDNKLKLRPTWRLLIDAHIYNIIDRDQFKRITRLRKKSSEIIKSFNSKEAIRELKKNYYNEWVKVIDHLIEKNNNLRDEWKRLIMKAQKS